MKAWHLLVIALSLAIGACGLFDLAEVDFDVVTDTDVKGAGEGAEETFTDEFCLKDYSGDID